MRFVKTRLSGCFFDQLINVIVEILIIIRLPHFQQIIAFVNL